MPDTEKDELSIPYMLGVLVRHAVLLPAIAIGRYWISSHVNELDELSLARSKRLVNYSTCISEIVISAYGIMHNNKDIVLTTFATGEAIRGMFNLCVDNNTIDDIIEEENEKS